jgi:ABC-type nitrate/sulfonate/bicarbonate transport system ATPase subunit
MSLMSDDASTNEVLVLRGKSGIGRKISGTLFREIASVRDPEQGRKIS